MVGEAPDEEIPFGPVETLWRFTLDLAARKLWPAIDPVLSTSTLQEGALLEAPHLIVQQRARKLLRRYRELRALVDVRGWEKRLETEEVSFRYGYARVGAAGGAGDGGRTSRRTQ
ncbi:MAG: hypothetical protein CL878_14410 [Dehalococcoidia bacterium]|nr:hypothetical protein [Dehalococcoidia bacterium]